ncbi:MAG: ankyrin repeat domain-containing protein [bacterium]|nr:ankyrin repeat domain-containing protein [bacterium]
MMEESAQDAISDSIAMPRNSALHSAANSGDLDAARRLLAGGADLHAVGKGGWTPLHVATFKGHLEMVALLLESGARVDDGALDFAREYGYEQIRAELEAARRPNP